MRLLPVLCRCPARARLTANERPECTCPDEAEYHHPDCPEYDTGTRLYPATSAGL